MDALNLNPQNSNQLASSIEMALLPSNIGVSAKVEKVPPATKVDIDRQPTISPGELADKIERLNKELTSRNQAVAFSSDATTGRDIVRVTNRTTGELIRQMPTAEALKAMQNIDQMMGLIFNKSV
jgi:flagellar protein FlaG